MSDSMTHMTVSEYLHYRRQMQLEKKKKKSEGFDEILKEEIKKESPSDQR